MDISPSSNESRLSNHSGRQDHPPAHDEPSGSSLPPPATYNENNEKTKPEGSPAGESGRRGFHPWKFLKINFKSASRASTLCNVLWPFVPAALAVRCELRTITKLTQHFTDEWLDATPDRHITIFALSYIAMVPCANLVGFAGQELARKMPHVVGVLTEVT